MAKLVVLYPQPTNPRAFEHIYAAEHVPLVFANFPTMTTFRTTQVLASPQGAAPYYWLVELHFASLDDLQEAAGTEGAQRTVGHGMQISTGGALTILICDDAQEIPLCTINRRDMAILLCVYRKLQYGSLYRRSWQPC